MERCNWNGVKADEAQCPRTATRRIYAAGLEPAVRLFCDEHADREAAALRTLAGVAIVVEPLVAQPTQLDRARTLVTSFIDCAPLPAAELRELLEETVLASRSDKSIAETTWTSLRDLAIAAQHFNDALDRARREVHA